MKTDYYKVQRKATLLSTLEKEREEEEEEKKHDKGNENG